MKTFCFVSFQLISLALVAVASAAVYPGELVHRSQEIKPDGSYSYSYDTGTGISAHESGVGGEVAEGTARWVAPDGTPVEFTYRADAAGYVATGSHVPETPEYVYRAIEWIRSHPSVEDKYKYDKYPTYKYTEPVVPVVPVVTAKPVVTPVFSTVSPVVPVSKVYKPTDFKYKSPVFPTVKPSVTVFKPSYTPTPFTKFVV
ncbi:pupal cuticle protein-like [Phlebotomus argentipes]|uniref:pupal cuticle protein-like n=1 Tax=Phlebotomus argentipes TaxID=94469 RepID=UPI002892A6E9|nr:pupal cuticle protein-like [Phlebotomus argentipes]